MISYIKPVDPKHRKGVARMQKYKKKLEELREKMSSVNEDLMHNLNDLFEISNKIGEMKDKMDLPHFDPVRESQMLKEILSKNKGPASQDILKRIFKEIFSATVDEMKVGKRTRLKVKRLSNSKGLVIDVKGIQIGGEKPVLIGGPCSVEDYEQIYKTAKKLKSLGIRVLRGGAFKPRTSPYSFQGLEQGGLKILRNVADEFDMAVITEVLNENDIPVVSQYADILQVGTRNMFNYSLLKEIGKIDKPIMLKRGFMATIDEFIFAAEYIYSGGNHKVILCERGIRTFETQTRNTLDISCVPILKNEVQLPVIVDVSHALGRKDILNPVAHAALAAGADGLMFEAHYNPAIALSDSAQQMNLEESQMLVDYLKPFFKFA